jgi:PAS domain S-box-containing protein
LARRADELEVLYDVSRKIIGSELASESLDGICSVAVDRLKASFASVHLFSVTGQMTAIAQKGIIPDVTAELENLRTVSDEGVELVQRPNGVWAIMPLMEGGEAIGAMVIGHTEHDWFTKERLAPFQSLSNLALLAIQKIRMIDALRLYANNLEDKVTERTKDLTETTLHLAEEVKRTKEAQERLFQEKERLDVTLHSIGEGVIVTDIIGTILLANRTAQETGANDDVPITGRQITDVLPIRDPVTEEPVKDHWISRGQDGSGSTEQKGVIIDLRGRRDLSYNSAPVRDRDGEAVGFVIVFRDITDDVKLQKAASEAQRLESIGQLAGGIAHSFNNILTSILGNIEMLNFDGLEESKKATCLDDARLSAMKAKDLSNQLLTFAKGGEPIRKNVSVIDLLNRTKEKLSNRSKINLQVSSESERYLVNADEVQMGQAFSNLMVNALASAPKGIILDVSVSYQDMDNDNAVSKTPSRYVVINMEAPNWISNRRAGFDLEPQNSTLDEKQGLDLAIANSIIRRHDGFMLMDSSAKGSNYKVYLPAWSECVSTPSARSKPRLDRPAKILVMDDDEGVLEVLTGMIEVLGHQVIAAKEGGEAIELFAQAETAGEPFDVVIMDLNIPGGLGGRETIRRLQERYTKVNVIVSSGYSNDPITANYISYGFKGVLPKPYTMKQLEEVIKKAMLDS